MVPSARRILIPALLSLWATLCAESDLPRLQRQGDVLQLIVQGKPWLARGGELGNSSGEPAYLRPYWPKLKSLNVNTLLVPIYWDRFEPEEGKFDFSDLDGLLQDARANNTRLVLLWFGVWKNSMSCYAPAWVKRDFPRFPRSQDSAGRGMEILSPFSPENLRVDARAFRTLMKHLREVDQQQQTVLMVQVENEVGMIPEARDHGAEAEKLFRQPVPAELLAYFATNYDQLEPELRDLWVARGKKSAGTWTEVFGESPATDEVFMAWYFARFIDALAKEGKAEYALPMYVNAALNRPGHKPGQYPSAGPLPHVFDVWRAGAPAIDFLAPDIYFTAFSSWLRKYVRPGNAVFVPETMRSGDSSVNALYAFATTNAMGFCPFAIETIEESAARYLTESYGLVAQLTPLIAEHQGRGTMAGLLPDGPEQRQPQQTIFGDVTLLTSFERTFGPALVDGAATPTSNATMPAGGLVIALGPDEFLLAGTGITTTFQVREVGGPQLGLQSVEEGRFVDGKWEHIRWLNGDQTHQGRHVRLEPNRFGIQRVKLYRYR